MSFAFPNSHVGLLFPDCVEVVVKHTVELWADETSLGRSVDVVEVILYPESDGSDDLWSLCLPAHTQNLIILPFLRRKCVIGNEVLTTIPEVGRCPRINEELLGVSIKFNLVRGMVCFLH